MIRQNSKGWFQFILRSCRVLPPLLDGLDIFHIQWAKTLVHYPEFIAKLQCPIILSLRGTHINVSPLADEKLASLYKKFFPKVNGFHAVSQSIIKKLIQKQINSNLLDNSKNFDENVLIINSFGKMSLYYSLSDIVILGGSFTRMGGHNPVEPAYNNCVVITGPHIYNWENVFLDMIQNHSCILCKTIKELEQIVNKLLLDNNKIRLFKKKAR